MTTPGSGSHDSRTGTGSGTGSDADIGTGSGTGSSADLSTQAAAKLAGLELQIDDAQALLVRLMQDVVEVESLQTLQTQQLLEANEELVIAALRAQGDADTASMALDGLSHAAEHDPLTGLPNRTLFQDRLQHAIASAARHLGCVAVLFVDLDDFKQINDRFGHEVGDLVLQQVAQRLLGVVRAVDTVSRHGGDEFLVLLTEVVRPVDAALVADKLLAALASPMRVDAHRLHISASIGISMHPGDAADARQLVAHADAAMYNAKRLGPGHFVFHGRLPAVGARPPVAPPAALPATAPAASPASLPAESLNAWPPELPPESTADATAESRPISPSAPAGADGLHAALREANQRLVLAALDAQTLRDAAQQAQARQAALIEVVAQELRNPAAPIRVAASMLGRLGATEPLLPRLQSMVEQHVAQMARLVGDLLDVARLGSGGLELPLHVVDVAAVVHTALDTWRPLLALRHQRLVVAMPGGPLLAHANTERLAQVVNNLLDNAAKYTHDHGQIDLTLVAHDDKVVLTVADNGIGITALALTQIFEPFAQATEAIGFNGVGLGIGLTVVRALLQAMGGSITASSAGSRQGSRFVVTLPRASALAGPAAGAVVSTAGNPADGTTGNPAGTPTGGPAGDTLGDPTARTGSQPAQ